MLFAGDFIQISFFEIYGAIFLHSIPGILLSVPILYIALQDRKNLLVIVTFFWIFVLPVLIILFTMLIAPDIHSRGHAYSTWQHILFVWVPIIGFPPLLAGLIWFKRRPKPEL
jgi:hypothetical protein